MTDQVLKGESSLADEIVQILRSRIINGEYAIGEKLVENKIAKELKVSRTPVREAFKQLTKENLIEYVPNKGCFAKGFEQSDLQDIYAVRIAVEQLAVAWAIKNKTDEDMAKLREQLEVMSLYTASGMVEKLIRGEEASGRKEAQGRGKEERRNKKERCRERGGRTASGSCSQESRSKVAVTLDVEKTHRTRPRFRGRVLYCIGLYGDCT